MAVYVVGDIQGCFAQLQKLLDKLRFDPARDVLWSVGDLVNRGPASLQTLRFFKELGDSAVCVLGNHDLHLLAIAYGDKSFLKKKDTLHDILAASDCADLLEWLRHRPFLHQDERLGWVMVHAGFAPQWDIAEARACAAEAEAVLRGAQHRVFFAEHMYGDQPDKWSKKLKAWERIRFISNAFTRLRYCRPDGSLALKKKYAPAHYDDKDLPWFQHPKRRSKDTRIVFGHWAALGWYQGDGVCALDTGCLWGGRLTALALPQLKVTDISCPGARKPKVPELAGGA